MDQELRGAAPAAPYDYRQHDRVWQRVAPSLSPYPGAVAAMAPETPSEDTLPGAQENPCCMGTAAQEDLSVVEGFIEGELSDRRYYQAFARQAPSSARQTLRNIAWDEGEHARQLMAAYYLITGQSYRPSISADRVYVGAYCPALRERYHEEACGWMNYIRASEGTTDPCLRRLFTDLAADELRHADEMRRLLEQALPGACGSR
jgi:rubrerythrin